MASIAEPIARLIAELNRLPGIGPKSAQRLTYHLLNIPVEEVNSLAEAILSLREKVELCSVCFNIADRNPCPICEDKERDHSRICVVEKPSDIIPLERTGKYKGLYHVLHGTVSPAQGTGAQELKVKELLYRLRGDAITEVILATNLTIEGEATAMYLRQMIHPLGIHTSRLARGLPFGSDLDYADDMTLGQALEGRQEF
jgi:recombination protein RecR